MYNNSTSIIQDKSGQSTLLGIVPLENIQLHQKDSEDYSILDAEILTENSPIKVKKIIFNSTITNSNYSNIIIDEPLELKKMSWRHPNPKYKEITRLSNLFVYRNYWTIKKYLNSNPQLRDLLFETYYKLVSFFDDKTQFILELVQDIYEPNFEQLFIRIVSKQEIHRNLNILDSFENKWWFERTAYFQNSPVITLE